MTPTSGPSGTQTTVTLSSLRSGDPISVSVGPGTRGLAADANGRAVFLETIYGRPGEVVDIRIVTGSGATEWTTTLRFTITGEEVPAGDRN